MMSKHIKYPEEVKMDAIEAAYQRFCEIRRRDVALKNLLVEYIADTRKSLEAITAADLVEFSNRSLASPVYTIFRRIESIPVPCTGKTEEMDKRF